MSEQLLKKKKQLLETEPIPSLEALILEAWEEAKIEEEKLKRERAKLSERDPVVEEFLRREKGALKRYNERRKLHFEIEQMPEKEIVSETGIPKAEYEGQIKFQLTQEEEEKL